MKRFISALLLLSSWCALSHAVLGGPIPLESQFAFGGIQPRLSPDGTLIAVSLQGAICRLPRSGGTLTRLTRAEGWDIDPVWSPDGRRIAFVNSQNFFLGQLRVINADDGSVVRLPTDVRARGRVAFAADGKKLLGLFSLAGQSDRLNWYHLETGELTAVDIKFPESTPRNPLQWALSQDGQSLLIATFQDLPGEQTGNNGPSSDLWIVPSGRGEAQHLVRWPSRIYNLCWDAAGAGIFVTTDRGTPFNDVWHIPLENSLAQARKLTFGQTDEDWPSVSNDGRWLVHAENHKGATALIVRELTANGRETLRVDRVDYRETTAQLRIKLVDAQTQLPVVARVAVKQRQGKFHAPIGTLYRLTAGQGHFYARGEAVLEIPVGTYDISGFHGPEFRGTGQEIILKDGEAVEVTLRFERWTDMPSKGWFSGENHIHANYGYGAWHNTPASVLDMCEGEDLNIGNIMVANSDGDGVFDRQFFLGRADPQSKPHTILYWNEEFRSTMWGHMTLINLDRLVEPIFTGFKDTTNPWDIPTNADVAQQTREQSGSVSYTHPAANVDAPYDTPYSAKGLPVDAALGRIDTLDVMGSGYEASIRVWYRLLNCGFKVPAAAGTDCFLNRIPSYPPGWGRAYVKLERGLSYSNWVAGQKAGQSFVSTGPMLEFTANGRDLGQTISLAGPGVIQVRGQARHEHALEKLELIYNGRVAAEGRLSTDRLSAMIDQDLKIEQSGWIALRTSSSQRTPLGLAAVAHTSPIYVQVPNRPCDGKADAEFFLAWIDRLDADLKRRNRIPVRRDHVTLQLEAARKIYRDIANSLPPRMIGR